MSCIKASSLVCDIVAVVVNGAGRCVVMALMSNYYFLSHLKCCLYCMRRLYSVDLLMAS